MGYRSDVCIAVDNDGAEILKLFAEISPPSMRTLLSEAETSTNEDCSKYMWYSVKWYEGYEEIDIIMSFLGQLSHDSWAYIRVGEETEDIDIKGDPYSFEMSVNRCIEW